MPYYKVIYEQTAYYPVIIEADNYESARKMIFNIPTDTILYSDADYNVLDFSSVNELKDPKEIEQELNNSNIPLIKQHEFIKQGE